MVYPFKVSDFIYAGQLDRQVVEKIEKHHLPVVSQLKGITYIVGYRSKEYELLKGRSGTSQHTFTGKGAVDLGTMNMADLFSQLVSTPYTRICFYPGFFHCDYKASQRTYYIENSGWDQVDKHEIMEAIDEFERYRSVDILYSVA